MKKETASEKRYKRLHKLISACIEHFSEDEMLATFGDITYKEYMESMDTDKMVSELSMQGYCIFKPDSISKSEQLREYAATAIFPYYNEQQTGILF